jgi:hypothetical protein
MNRLGEYVAEGSLVALGALGTLTGLGCGHKGYVPEDQYRSSQATLERSRRNTRALEERWVPAQAKPKASLTPTAAPRPSNPEDDVKGAASAVSKSMDYLETMAHGLNTDFVNRKPKYGNKWAFDTGATGALYDAHDAFRSSLDKYVTALESAIGKTNDPSEKAALIVKSVRARKALADATKFTGLVCTEYIPATKECGPVVASEETPGFNLFAGLYEASEAIDSVRAGN